MTEPECFKRIFPDTATSTHKMAHTGEAELISQTITYVRKYMAHYDSSHDISHIRRVLGLALHLHTSIPSLNRLLVTLAALLHDIGDKKYLPPGTTSGATLVEDFLLSIDCDPKLAADVQTVVNHVSYSNEIKHPEEVKEVLARLPELGVVQDADRLDAIGAVGIGRTFTYGASVRAGKVAERAARMNAEAESVGKGGCGRQTGIVDGMNTQREEALGSSMDDSMVHFVEKLERLEGMMKTEMGRKMARERTERLKQFRGWWEEEVGLAVDDDFSGLL